MKKRFILATAIIMNAVVACTADAPSKPEYETQLTAATAPLPHLLPEATMLAVEIRDLERRWSEIRAHQLLAELQDRLLAEIELEPDHLPVIAGDRAVFAIASADGGRVVLPVAVLLPPDVERAEELLSSFAPSWTVLRARGALWVAPRSAADELKEVAWGDGTSLAQAIPMDEVDRRLPAGGLVRGWVNPKAFKQVIHACLRDRLFAWTDVMGRIVSAELDALRWIGFRRDIEPGQITADAIIAYDTGVLPAEFSDALDPGASSPWLPSSLPDDVAIAAAFRAEAQIALPWLRYLANRDPDGPFRNLEFWLEEFEERSRLSLERDLFHSIGEHGWLLAFESMNGTTPQWVMVLEAVDAARAKRALLALLNWSAEHAWMKTLGLAVPKVQDTEVDGTLIHTLVVSTPVGELAGPAFASVDGYLLMAMGSNPMRSGIGLIEDGAFSTRPSDAGQGQGSLMVRGPPLARLADSMLRLVPETGDRSELIEAMVDIFADVPGFSGNLYYEGDAVRLSGEVLLNRD
jgi:hypothetical protein